MNPEPVLRQIIRFCEGGKTSLEIRTGLNLSIQRVSRDLWHLMKYGRVFRVGKMGHGRYFNAPPTPEQIAAVEEAIAAKQPKKENRSDPEYLAKRRERERKRRRALGIQPKEKTVRKALRIKREIPRSSVKWTPAQKAEVQIVIPEGLKVTVCPPCQVERFKFDPPPGWVGQITKDRDVSRQTD